MNKITLFYICFIIVSQTYGIHASTAPAQQDILLLQLLNGSRVDPAQVHLHVKSMPVEQGKSPEIYLILHDAQYLSSNIDKLKIFTSLIENHKKTKYALIKSSVNNRYSVCIDNHIIAQCETEHIPHSKITPTVVLAYLLPQKLAAKYYENPKSMEPIEYVSPKLIRLADERINPSEKIIIQTLLNNTDINNENSFSVKNITERECDEITSKNHNICGKTDEEIVQQNSPKSFLSWRSATAACFILVMAFLLIDKGCKLHIIFA